MSTRSTIIIRTATRDYGYYVHYDGYFSGVGNALILAIRAYGIDRVAERIITAANGQDLESIWLHKDPDATPPWIHLTPGVTDPDRTDPTCGLDITPIGHPDEPGYYQDALSARRRLYHVSGHQLRVPSEEYAYVLDTTRAQLIVYACAYTTGGESWCIAPGTPAVAIIPVPLLTGLADEDAEHVGAALSVATPALRDGLRPDYADQVAATTLTRPGIAGFLLQTLNPALPDRIAAMATWGGYQPPATA